MKKYLISYGDVNYANQKLYLKNSALSSTFFDEITLFGPEDISRSFAAKVGEALVNKKGGGYWLWKPYFIKHVLDQIKWNDTLIYCDAGCLINPGGSARFNQYIDIINYSTTGTIDFELAFKEYEYTKQEIFDYYQSSKYIIESNQLMATVIILRKCKHTVELINEWYNVACEYPFLFTDDFLLKEQHEDFIDCRHDQSVFSVIRKTKGANIIPDETYFSDFIRYGNSYPFWATRFKS